MAKPSLPASPRDRLLHSISHAYALATETSSEASEAKLGHGLFEPWLGPHNTKSQKQFPFDDKVAKTALVVESSKAETLCPPSTSSASCAGAHTLTHSIRICLVMLSWAGCADVQGPYWPYTTSVFPPGPAKPTSFSKLVAHPVQLSQVARHATAPLQQRAPGKRQFHMERSMGTSRAAVPCSDKICKDFISKKSVKHMKLRHHMKPS